MMFLARRLGRRDLRIGNWDSLERAQVGGRKERGGLEWNFSSKPWHIIEEAVGSPKESHASLWEEIW